MSKGMLIFEKILKVIPNTVKFSDHLLIFGNAKGLFGICVKQPLLIFYHMFELLEIGFYLWNNFRILLVPLDKTFSFIKVLPQEIIKFPCFFALSNIFFAEIRQSFKFFIVFLDKSQSFQQRLTDLFQKFRTLTSHQRIQKH